MAKFTGTNAKRDTFVHLLAADPRMTTIRNEFALKHGRDTLANAAHIRIRNDGEAFSYVDGRDGVRYEIAARPAVLEPVEQLRSLRAEVAKLDADRVRLLNDGRSNWAMRLGRRAQQLEKAAEILARFLD